MPLPKSVFGQVEVQGSLDVTFNEINIIRDANAANPAVKWSLHITPDGDVFARNVHGYTLNAANAINAYTLNATNEINIVRDPNAANDADKYSLHITPDGDVFARNVHGYTMHADTLNAAIAINAYTLNATNEINIVRDPNAANDADKYSLHITPDGDVFARNVHGRTMHAYELNATVEINIVKDPNAANDVDKYSLHITPDGDVMARNLDVMNIDAEHIKAWGNITCDGDISLTGADCAEDFALVPGADVEAGNVMVIGRDGALLPCAVEYDTRVAGVVSGAGALKPGLRLGKLNAATEPTVPLALIGKVFCKVDAQYGSIEIGDLLTTSPTPGHAMKVQTLSRATGSIIGKALGSHSEDTGLIPILLALQ